MATADPTLATDDQTADPSAAAKKPAGPGASLTGLAPADPTAQAAANPAATADPMAFAPSDPQLGGSGAPPASAPPGEDGHGRPRADSENVLDSANSPPITLNDGRLVPPTASAAQVATLTSFELAPLAGSVLGSIIYNRAQQTAFPQDDGTFRAPAEALIALFDENNDGWLSLQEARDAILTFATATHPLDPSGQGVTIDDLVTVANNLSKSLLSVSAQGANKVSADDIEVWLESELVAWFGAPCVLWQSHHPTIPLGHGHNSRQPTPLGVRRCRSSPHPHTPPQMRRRRLTRRGRLEAWSRWACPCGRFIGRRGEVKGRLCVCAPAIVWTHRALRVC